MAASGRMRFAAAISVCTYAVQGFSGEVSPGRINCMSLFFYLAGRLRREMLVLSSTLIQIVIIESYSKKVYLRKKAKKMGLNSTASDLSAWGEPSRISDLEQK